MLLGLNYYGNTIEVLTCNGSICEIRNFAVTDFECLLQLLSYLHRTLASMETDLSFEEPLEDKSTTETGRTLSARVQNLEIQVSELVAKIEELII